MLSPSMTAADSFSRVKMCSNARLTVVVPAPDEPVTTTTGCFLDMKIPPRKNH